MIRAGWQERSLDSVAAFVNGGAFSDRDWADHGVPIIRIQNLNGGTEFNYFPGDPPAEYMVRDGDLLFSWSGSRGVSFGARVWKGPLAVLNQHIFKVQARAGMRPEFLAHLLAWITPQVERRAHGAAGLVHVTKKDLLGFRVCFPESEATQIRIAHILDGFGLVIGRMEAILAAMEGRERALMQRLLTPTFPRNPIPKGSWARASMGQAFIERRVKNPSGLELPVITVGMTAIRRQDEHFSRNVASADRSAYWLINPGEFVYDPMSAYYGVIGRYEIASPGVVSPAYRVIRPTSAFSSNFLKWVVRSHRVRFELVARSSQNNKEGKRRLLSRTAFNSIEFDCPSALDQQSRIARALDAAELEAEGCSRLLAALRLQKRGVMQKLLSGEIELPDVESTPSAPAPEAEQS